VDRDRSLRPISSKIAGYFLEHINRQAGYDWHSAKAIAEDLGVHVSAVEKGIAELLRTGVILRDVETAKGRGRGTRRWRTTIPMLVRASEEVSREHKKQSDQDWAMDPPKKSDGPTQEIRWTHPRKSDGPTQEKGSEPIEEPVEESLSPQPPKRAKRARGARARDETQISSEADQLLAPLRGEPDWANAVTLLIEPIARRRRVLAPDPAHALRDLAAWASRLPDSVLQAAAYRVLETRHSAVTDESILAAVRAVQREVGQAPALDRPAVPAVAADGLLTITEREHPEAFAAWIAHHRARKRKAPYLATAERHGFVREPTLFPPAPTADPLPQPILADATIH
jgi:biotin operon repressor